MRYVVSLKVSSRDAAQKGQEKTVPFCENWIELPLLAWNT